MKVAFVSQPFSYLVPPVQAGSVPIWTYEVGRRLHAKGAEIVVYSRSNGTQAKTEEFEGIEYRRINGVALEDRLLRLLRFFERVLRHPFPGQPIFASALYYLGYITQIAKDLQSQSCDIVHVYNFSQFIPILRRYNPDIKIVLNMRCEWLTQLDRTTIEKRIRQADMVLGCSQFITTTIRDEFPHYQPVHTVLNGTNPDQFMSSPNGSDEAGVKRLLFVGRISPEKGIHVLLKAFEKVAQRHPQAILDIVGPQGSSPYEYIVLINEDEEVKKLGQYYSGYLRRRNYYAQLQASLPNEIRDKVNFVGAVPHRQVVQYYDRSDILINPSLSESFGRSLIEAMSMQVPVIATQVGGMQEIVLDGETGLLVAPNDAEALADAILELLNDEYRRKSMGRAGRQRVLGHYSWDLVTDSLYAQYQALVGSVS